MQAILTKNSTYRTLRVGAEFMGFCGRHWQRCRVTKILEISDEAVRLRIQPASTNRNAEEHIAQFHPDAHVEILEATPTRALAIERYSEAILEVFGGDRTLVLSCLDISDRLRESGIDLIRGRVSNICLHLAGEKQLCKRVGKKLRYRLPLPVGVVNFPVVEFWEKGSQKLGWIVDWRIHRGTNSQQPVVRFTTGEERFSQEMWLDPAQADHLTHIEIAQKRQAGTLEIPIPIPEWMLLELRQNWHSTRSRSAAIHALAVHLGYLSPDSSFAGRGRHQARNQALDYLYRYYPNWNSGNLYRVG